MARIPEDDPKLEALRQSGTLNPRPGDVTDELFAGHGFFDARDQIASFLNERGLNSGEGKPFTARIVAGVRRRHGLTLRYDRLRKAGMLTAEEMAPILGISPQSVKIWARHGLLRGHTYNDKNDCLFEHPGNNPPRKAQGVKLSERRFRNEFVAQGAQEVQYKA